MEKEFLDVGEEFLDVGEEFPCGYLGKTRGFFVKTIGFFVFAPSQTCVARQVRGTRYYDRCAFFCRKSWFVSEVG